MSSTHFNCVIVGAGITGLTIAKSLSGGGNNCASIAVIEKSRSCGGRLATRRVYHEGKQFSVDTGAQFMTVRSEAFSSKVVEPSLNRSRLHVWCRGFDSIAGDGHPRYASRLGMNGFLNDLYPDGGDDGDGGSFRRLLDTKVVTVTYDPNRAFQLQVVDTNKNGQTQPSLPSLITCKNLVLTMPLPQSLALLGDTFPYDNFFREKTVITSLRQKQYHPCICIILIVRHAHGEEIKFPGVWKSSKPESSSVQWVASNRAKGIKVEGDYEGSDFSAFTVHCTPSFSQSHYDETDKYVILDLIVDEIQGMTGSLIRRQSIVEIDMKKWKFSIPIVKDEKDYLDKGIVGGTSCTDDGDRLLFAGDSFTRQPRIEACFESAIAAHSFLT